MVIVTVACLCEFAWVLGRSYKFACEDIAEAIRSVVEKPAVKVDRLAVAAGLSMLDWAEILLTAPLLAKVVLQAVKCS